MTVMTAVLDAGRRIDCRAQFLTLSRSVTVFLLLYETVFNLCVDLVQPLLGTLSSVLIRCDFASSSECDLRRHEADARASGPYPARVGCSLQQYRRSVK